jgi:hypothetical protein
MSDLLKWRFRFVMIVLIALAFLGWSALRDNSLADEAQRGQDLKPVLQMLPSSTKGPPEMENLKEDKGPPDKARTNPSRDVLLQEVAKQPRGQEKVQQAKARHQGAALLRSSSTAPPEMEKLKEEKGPPDKARTNPSRDVLLQEILKQPGGHEKIQRANPKGFKLGPRSEKPGWSIPLLSYLNPFQAGVAQASGTPLILTPYAPSKTSPFPGKLYIDGELSGAWNLNTYYARLFNFSTSSQIGTQILKPCTNLQVTVPISGWYLVNFETWNGAWATLKHYTPAGYVTVQTWDQRGKTAYVDHPALLNLSAGSHNFYWIVNGGNIWLGRVTVEKL